MDTVIEDGWRDLTACQRDVLVTLAIEGPLSTKQIHDRARADVNGTTTTYRAVYALQDKGFVTVDGHGTDGGKQNTLTDEGRRLVGRVVVGYDRVLES